MRILHICETARGGVGTYINTLVKVGRSGDEQQVVVPAAHRSMLDEGVDCRTFVYPRRSLSSLFRMLGTALRAGLSFRPHIVFCHSSFALLALMLLKPMVPSAVFLYCPHGWAGLRKDGAPWKSWILRRIEGLLCGLADRVINVSQSEFNHACEHAYRGYHTLVENGVLPPPTFLSATNLDLDGEQECIHLLFVGRHDFEKGLDVLLDAFEKAWPRRPELRLTVIGENVISSTAIDRGSKAACSNAIRWLGWLDRDHIDAYYRSADLVVVPSRREGLPLVIPEALRNGTPVLVSDRSGLPDLITPGMTGYVCPVDSGALADMLVGLERPALARMRDECVELFNRRYHADRFGREIHAIYEALSRRGNLKPSREDT